MATGLTVKLLCKSKTIHSRNDYEVTLADTQDVGITDLKLHLGSDDAEGFDVGKFYQLTIQRTGVEE